MGPAKKSTENGCQPPASVPSTLLSLPCYKEKPNQPCAPHVTTQWGVTAPGLPFSCGAPIPPHVLPSRAPIYPPCRQYHPAAYINVTGGHCPYVDDPFLV